MWQAMIKDKGSIRRAYSRAAKASENWPTCTRLNPYQSYSYQFGFSSMARLCSTSAAGQSQSYWSVAYPRIVCASDNLSSSCTAVLAVAFAFLKAVLGGIAPYNPITV